MIIAFNKALVRVNSNNILPIEFLADELPILQGIWGAENIQDVTPIGRGMSLWKQSSPVFS